MDWIHCNTCYARPSSSNGAKFCISSCGHLFCANCLNNSEKICRVCKKECRFLEVNRSLKADLQIFFKEPIDILKQNMRSMKSVIEFQSFHRTRLQKHLNEKFCAKQFQGELMKISEREKSLQSNLRKQNNMVHNLQNLIAEKDRELMHWRKKFVAMSSSTTLITHAQQKSQNRASPALTRCVSAMSHSGRANTSANGARLISLDSPIAFSGRASNSSFGSSSSVTPIPYQPSNINIKPTILASYSISSRSSHNSTNSETSSFNSAAKSVIMSGRITKGSVLPRSASHHLK